MKHFILFLLLIFTLPLAAQWTLETVPSPKSARTDNWVSNPDGIFSRVAEYQLEEILESIERKTGIEVTVVALGSIGDEVPADFSLQLFNKWGVGKAESNNGLLILMVKDQRRIEFTTGYGMEAQLPDALCYQIQQDYIVPKFKQGDYNGGMLAGIKAVANILIGEGWDSSVSPQEEQAMQSLAAKLPDKLKAGEWLLDVDAIFYDSMRLALNQQAAILNDSFNLEVRIVVFRNMGTLSVAKMSEFLANKWGQREALPEGRLLLVIDVATLKTHIHRSLMPGHTLDDDDLINWILISARNAMNEHPEWALSTGIEKSLKEIQKLNIDDTYGDFVRSEIVASEVPEPYYPPIKKKSKGSKFWWNLFLIYLWALGILLALTVVFVGFAQLIKDPYKQYQSLSFFSLDIWMYLFPIPYILVGILIDRLRKYYRYAPRNDPKTGLAMEMLSETEEDNYLKAGQITEEQINSIHYDVWACADRKELLILPYKTLFSKYGRCPKCAYRTYYLVYNRTITPATTSSSGTGEKKHTCKHCNHSRTTRYTIPRIDNSSSSSSGGSSGGSFGGGSSGGGGAGSSW